MNEQAFNKELKRYAKDLQLIFDHREKLWGIYQVRASHIIGVGPAETRPWLLFHIRDDLGNFRLPDNRDIHRVIKSVTSAHTMWEKGADAYVDQIEAQEDARKQKGQEHTNDTIGQAAKYASRSIRRGGKIYR